MFDKELSEKFLAKIADMSDEELQQRAEKASSSGMTPIIEEMIEFNSERIEEDLKVHMFLITSENKDIISVEESLEIK